MTCDHERMLMTVLTPNHLKKIKKIKFQKRPKYKLHKTQSKKGLTLVESKMIRADFSQVTLNTAVNKA